MTTERYVTTRERDIKAMLRESGMPEDALQEGWEHILHHRPNERRIWQYRDDKTGRWGHDPGTTRGRRRGARELVRFTRGRGGFTYSPTTARVPKRGVAVSPYPSRSESFPAKYLVPQHIKAYMERNRDLLARDKHYLGAWHDKESGQVWLDVVVVTNKRDAIERGRAANQIAVYDLGTGEEIQTGGSGLSIDAPPDSTAFLGTKKAQHRAYKDGFEQGREAFEKGLTYRRKRNKDYNAGFAAGWADAAHTASYADLFKSTTRRGAHARAITSHIE